MIIIIKIIIFQLSTGCFLCKGNPSPGLFFPLFSPPRYWLTPVNILLTVTDFDGRSVTVEHEPQRIILQDGRDIMAMALLDRDDPFKRLVAWNNLGEKTGCRHREMLKTAWPEATHIMDMGFSDKGNVDWKACCRNSRI